MLVRLGEIHHLSDFRFGHFIAENATNADAFLVDMQHHARCVLHAHPEKALKAQDDEFHRRVIVIQYQNLVRRWLFGARARSRGDAYTCATIVVPSFISSDYLHEFTIWQAGGGGQDV